MPPDVLKRDSQSDGRCFRVHSVGDKAIGSVDAADLNVSTAARGARILESQQEQEAVRPSLLGGCEKERLFC